MYLYLIPLNCFHSTFMYTLTLSIPPFDRYFCSLATHVYTP